MAEALDWTKAAVLTWAKDPDPRVERICERWTPGKVLDLGCGNGRHARWFHKRGFAVTAQDSSDEAVRLTLGAVPVEARVEDFRALSYPPNSFDYVLAFHAIFHTDVAGVKSALSEIRRVLRPGGQALVTFRSKTLPDFFAAPERIGPNTVRMGGVRGDCMTSFFEQSEVDDLIKDFRCLDHEFDGSSWCLVLSPT